MLETTATLGQPALDVDQPEPDDIRYWSVTTLIGVLDKPALLYWSAQQAAEAAIDNEAVWKAMLSDRGRDEAVKWLRDARFRRPKDRLGSADLGSAVHQLCEEYALTGTRPTKDRAREIITVWGGTNVDVDTELETVGQMVNRFDDWLGRAQPSYQATEVVVYNPEYGYAGTADAFLTLDGVRFLADYKSTREPFDSKGNLKSPYPEVALQLAGYRWATHAAVWRPRRTTVFRRRYYLLGPDERAMAQPVPEVDAGLCIHITPASCEAYPVRCDETIFRSFLFTLEAARWVFETSKNVIGSPLEFES